MFPWDRGFSDGQAWAAKSNPRKLHGVRCSIRALRTSRIPGDSPALLHVALAAMKYVADLAVTQVEVYRAIVAPEPPPEERHNIHVGLPYLRGLVAGIMHQQELIGV